MPDFNFLDYVPGFLGGTGNGTPEQVGMLPAAVIAAKQWHDAQQYRDSAQQAAQVANPFGDQRAQYAGLLSKAYADPASVMNSPQFQAINKNQMNMIANYNGAHGFQASGKNDTELGRYLAQANAQQFDTYTKNLGNLAGAQFDPANAANIMVKGDTNAIGSQNAALSTLGSLYTAGAQRDQQNRTTANQTSAADFTSWMKSQNPQTQNLAQQLIAKGMSPGDVQKYLSGQMNPGTGVYGDPNGSGGYGGGGTGIDPNNPNQQIDYSTGNVYVQQPDGSWQVVGNVNDMGPPENMGPPAPSIGEDVGGGDNSMPWWENP